AFEDVDAGPRATAMAGAYAAQSEGVSSVFYNPAGVIGVSRYEVLLAQQTLFMGLTDGSSISRNAIAFGSPLTFGGSYWGTAAFALDTLSLDSLYTESRMRLAWAYPLKERLWIGVALANMSVSYGSDEYTAANPVLSEGSGISAMALDIGVIHSGKKADFGLSIQNANEPDLGIKYENTVARKITMGAALKFQSFTLGTDLSFGGGDLRLKTGSEFPLIRSAGENTLKARAGLAVGSRDYRALTTGFGYAMGSYRIEYSFSYPLSGLADTMGSHQFGLSAAWGEARGPMADREEEDSAAKPEDRLPGGSGDEGEGAGAAPRKTEPTRQDRKEAGALLRDASNNMRRGNYAKAAESFKKANELLMNTNPALEDLLPRVEAVRGVLPAATARRERDKLLRDSVDRYMQKNTDAVLYITYARQKWPKDPAVSRLYRLISGEFPETAANLRILPGITVIDQLLQDALDSIRNGRFIQAISILQQVLQLEPDNIPALTRMGSAYWAMEKKDIARQNWQRVLQLDPNNTEVIQFMKMN
ncbi:MAG: type IX secretion system membrane protein PorP/SprF, partial [Elusimicrobiales bacterium]|nr:type IX secretion system membrane protein PorP/SprF [Elusimicrobiales bacterium]